MNSGSPPIPALAVVATKKRETPLEQPFRGLVNYAAVLCFLFEEREAVYFALRAMFARYWCKLNALRSGSGMLLCLLRLFEVRLCPRTEVVVSRRLVPRSVHSAHCHAVFFTGFAFAPLFVMHGEIEIPISVLWRPDGGHGYGGSHFVRTTSSSLPRIVCTRGLE